jgi:antitoxin (DNA-binding transcriptional repressor) of toxin-antitoxin stability system
MSKQISVTDLKARLADVLEEVEQGVEFEITKHGHPIARLSRTRASAGPMASKDMFAGIVSSAVNEDMLIDTSDMWDEE